MFLHRTRGCFDWAVAKANRQQVDDLSSRADAPCRDAPDVLLQGSVRIIGVVKTGNEIHMDAVAGNARDRRTWVKLLWWILRSDDMYRDRVKLCNSHFS